jgi:hypothetical protein
MNIDFLSCTKYLYLAEKMLNDRIMRLPFKEEVDDKYAKRFGMTGEELVKICDQFEYGKLLEATSIPVETFDKYGNLEYEVDDEGLFPNKKKISEFIDYIKPRFRLREKPVISREAISSISTQCGRIFDSDTLAKIITAFSISDSIATNFAEEDYTLIDILFRHAYADAWIKTLGFALAEFLNPIYYDIPNKEQAVELFEYMDGILSVSADEKDYQDFLKEASKYLPDLLPTKPLKETPPQNAMSLKGKEVEFDEALPAIVIDDEQYPLPPSKNEDYFARIMFRHRIGEFVDWSLIYATMEGVDSQRVDVENEKNKKMVRDTLNRLNKRIKELAHTEEDLFSWKNKSICRNF